LRTWDFIVCDRLPNTYQAPGCQQAMASRDACLSRPAFAPSASSLRDLRLRFDSRVPGCSSLHQTPIGTRCRGCFRPRVPETRRFPRSSIQSRPGLRSSCLRAREKRQSSSKERSSAPREDSEGRWISNQDVRLPGSVRETRRGLTARASPVPLDREAGPSWAAGSSTAAPSSRPGLSGGPVFEGWGDQSPRDSPGPPNETAGGSGVAASAIRRCRWARGRPVAPVRRRSVRAEFAAARFESVKPRRVGGAHEIDTGFLVGRRATAPI